MKGVLRIKEDVGRSGLSSVHHDYVGEIPVEREFLYHPLVGTVVR
jgi:hypothetical protein